MGDVSVLEEVDDPNLEEKAALGDPPTDAAKDPTPNEHSTSSQQSAVPVIVSDLEKSDDSDQMKQASLDQLPDYHIMNDPKKDDPQLTEQITPGQISAGSSGQLSFVASHVSVNFRDRSNSTSHASPVAMPEQGKFTFTFKLSNVDPSKRSIKSPVHVIAKLPWGVGVRQRMFSDRKSLSVNMDCNSECTSNIWSCEADVKIKLLSHDPLQHPFVKNKTVNFNYGKTHRGSVLSLEWNKLMDPNNGYVNNDEATLEVEVIIKKMIGFREFSEFDFVSDTPGSNSDVVLIVQGKRINICKHYLSVYSPVFHAMFFSDFSERDKKEIILEDLALTEFLELLHVIYPTHKPVTHDNVDFLLELGDRFEIQFVISECERFLLSTTAVSLSEKLVYADKYRLAKLQDASIMKIKGHADVKSLEKCGEYEAFTDKTKAAILDRLMKVV